MSLDRGRYSFHFHLVTARKELSLEYVIKSLLVPLSLSRSPLEGSTSEEFISRIWYTPSVRVWQKKGMPLKKGVVCFLVFHGNKYTANTCYSSVDVSTTVRMRFVEKQSDYERKEKSNQINSLFRLKTTWNSWIFLIKTCAYTYIHVLQVRAANINDSIVYLDKIFRQVNIRNM